MFKIVRRKNSTDDEAAQRVLDMYQITTGNWQLEYNFDALKNGTIPIRMQRRADL